MFVPHFAEIRDFLEAEYAETREMFAMVEALRAALALARLYSK